jgi:plastocyanin
VNGPVPRLAVSAVASVAILAAGTVAVDRSLRVGTGPAPAAEGAGPAVTLTIAGFAYAPDPLVVPAGSSVAVTNQDGSAHTVTSGTRAAPDGRFDLDVEASASASLAAPPPGTYVYFCDIHPGMKATLQVTP